MEYGGIPLLEDQNVVFPEGIIDLENGTLSDLEDLFGQKGAVDPELPEQSKHRLFFSQKGLVRAFFQPEQRLEDNSRVLTLDFQPESEIPLAWFIEAYGQDLKGLPCVPINDEGIPKFLAIFSLNLYLTNFLNTGTVEAINFVSNQHILSCNCDICRIIRQVMAQKDRLLLKK